jgi:hypothetical protein
VLGGYGFSDVSLVEKQTALAAVPDGDLDTHTGYDEAMTFPDRELFLSIDSDVLTDVSYPLQYYINPLAYCTHITDLFLQSA